MIAVPVRCNRCNKGYHQKCSTGHKASSRDINWNYNKWAKILQQSSSDNITQTTSLLLNNVSATRTKRITGNDSTPDLLLVFVTGQPTHLGHYQNLLAI